jgi:hypothetical protein
VLGLNKRETLSSNPSAAKRKKKIEGYYHAIGYFAAGKMMG